jgi:hypothetical protein
MRKAPGNIAEHQKSRTESFASVARSFGEANNRYQTLAAESFGRAVEIQSQFVGEAYESYIAQMSQIGKMFFAGYSGFIPLPQVRPAANLNKRKTADRHRASTKPKVNSKPRRRAAAAQSMTTSRAAAAQSMTTSRKTGTVATQISKRPAKTERRHKG